MNITEDLGFRRKLIKKMEEREFAVRTGVHCTDLIYCVNKQALRKLNPVETQDKELLLFSLGWATQRWLTGQDEDEPEKIVDGITVTCDALVDDNVPWELKCTFQSSSRKIEENAHWLHQIMAQCHVMGAKDAYLSRLEIMGDWKSLFKPKGFKDWGREEQLVYENEHQKPTLHAYHLEFTEEEIARNWTWLKERKTLFETVLESKKLMPKAVALASGQAFECDWCHYKDECGG